MSNTLSSFRFAAIAAGSAALALPAAAGDLPPPYVSRALDAVLIPVDASVRDAFKLAKDETGVLVLAVSPNGVAEQAGIAPGDVIAKAHGRAVSDPITLDEIVYYWIKKDKFDFGFDGWQGGKSHNYTTTIRLASYLTEIDVVAVATWTAYSYESFSYADYTTEYSSEIASSYEESETTIEETATSEEFATEETTDEAMSEDTTTDEAGSDEAGSDDPAATGDADGDEPAAGDEAGGDEPAADDGGSDEPAASSDDE